MIWKPKGLKKFCLSRPIYPRKLCPRAMSEDIKGYLLSTCCMRFLKFSIPIVPEPSWSKSWKATLNIESGRLSVVSNATNSPILKMLEFILSK